MVSAHDVAAYIIGHGPMSSMKLLKLLYYSQAWSIAWDGSPLFTEDICAWADGPVVHEVWHVHRGGRVVAHHPRGDAHGLSAQQRATVDAVLGFYGTYDGDTLSKLTHRERPWLDSFVAHVRPSPVITHEALRAYYRADAAPRKRFSQAFSRGVDYLLSLDADSVEAFDMPEWSTETSVDVHDEIAYLEGRGADPWLQ